MQNLKIKLASQRNQFHVKSVQQKNPQISKLWYYIPQGHLWHRPKTNLKAKKVGLVASFFLQYEKVRKNSPSFFPFLSLQELSANSLVEKLFYNGWPFWPLGLGYGSVKRGTFIVSLWLESCKGLYQPRSLLQVSFFKNSVTVFPTPEKYVHV